MKTDKSFKMKSQTKRILATIDDKNEYAFYKRISIESQLIYESAQKRIAKTIKNSDTNQ